MIAFLKEFDYDAIEFFRTDRCLCFELMWEMQGLFEGFSQSWASSF
jgi:hypothetical protein